MALTSRMTSRLCQEKFFCACIVTDTPKLVQYLTIFAEIMVDYLC